jgi:hypothetical protein
MTNTLSDDELRLLVAESEQAMERAAQDQATLGSGLSLDQRAHLRDRVAECTLDFTRATNLWHRRLLGEG